MADAEHQWLVEKARGRASARMARRAVVQELVTTQQMAGQVGTRHQGNNFSIPLAGPVETSPAELPVPPYTLGVWLGDGDTDQPVVTSADPEVIAALAADGARFGSTPYQYGGRTPRYRMLGVAARWREAGVLGSKRIPSVYLRASVSQRRSLLAGLMDSDGYVSPLGQCEYTTISAGLADDVQELVRSLGWKARLARGRAMLMGRHIGPKFRVTFLPHEQICRLLRKAKRVRLSPERQVRTRGRFIVSVSPTDSVPVRCIKVDSPSHLYLASKAFIATHNTHTVARACSWFMRAYPTVAKVITTAPTWHQVENLMWREVRGGHAKTRYPFGRPPLNVRWEPDPTNYPEWVALGLSTNTPVNFQGHHAPKILIVGDEADGLPDSTMEALDSLLTTAGAKAIFIGNPLDPNSAFKKRWDLNEGNPRVLRLTITADDVLELTDQGLYPFLLQRAWVERKRRQWGEDSPMWFGKVLAEWPDVGGNRVIPMAWLQRAKGRSGAPGYRTLGVDVGPRAGTARTARTLMNGGSWLWTRAKQHVDTVVTAMEVIRDKLDYSVMAIQVDDTGVGGGVVDQIHHKGHAVKGVNNGHPCEEEDDRKVFANQGSRNWWKTRLMFEQNLLGFEDVASDPEMLDDLIAELSRSTYDQQPGGKLIVDKMGLPRGKTEKSLTTEELQDRSPDLADSFILAVTAKPVGVTIERAARYTIDRAVEARDEMGVTVRDYDAEPRKARRTIDRRSES